MHTQLSQWIVWCKHQVTNTVAKEDILHCTPLLVATKRVHTGEFTAPRSLCHVWVSFINTLTLAKPHIPLWVLAPACISSFAYHFTSHFTPSLWSVVLLLCFDISIYLVFHWAKSHQPERVCGRSFHNFITLSPWLNMLNTVLIKNSMMVNRSCTKWVKAGARSSQKQVIIIIMGMWL